MASSVSFNNPMPPEQSLDSGGTSQPFTNAGLSSTASDPNGDEQVIQTSLAATFVSPFAPSYPGLITDPTGGGAPISTGFSEDILIGGSTNSSAILNRLNFIAPTLANGQSLEDNLTVSTFTEADGATDSNIAKSTIPIDIVTAPQINIALPMNNDEDAPLRAFIGVNISDPDFVNTGLDTATITITDSSDATLTDADGVLNGSGIGKTGTGTYVVANAMSSTALSSVLEGLTFTPVVGTAKTTVFNISVTDTRANLTANSTLSVVTPPIEQPPPPQSMLTISGAVANQLDEGPVHPFAAMSVTDSSTTPLDAATITITDLTGTATDALGMLEGVGLIPTGVGTYSIPNPVPPATLDAVLENLIFTPILGPTVTTAKFSVTVTDATLSSTDSTTSVVLPTMMSVPSRPTTAFVPATSPAAEQFVASDGTLSPFTGLAITESDPPTDAQFIGTALTQTFASPGIAANPGTIIDPAEPNAGDFEGNIIGTTNSATVLGRFVFTAPTLEDGQSIEDNLVVSTWTAAQLQSTSTDPTGNIPDSNPAMVTIPIDVVTAPGIAQASTTQSDGSSPFNPFATMVVTDPDFVNTGLDTATITITDPAGAPTDADGVLSGVGLAKTGVGTYSIPNPISPALLTAVLQNLIFTPVVGTAATTATFNVAVTDTKAGLTNMASTSVLTAAATPPIVSGAVVSQSDLDASINPFAAMVVADTNFANTALDTATITVADPAGTLTDADGLLSGIGLAKTGVGTYSVPNPISPAVLSTVLENLKFTPIIGTSDKNTTFDVSVADTKAGVTGTDSITSVVTPGESTPPPPPPPPSNLTAFDTTTQTFLDPINGMPQETPYTGPVAGLSEQYINLTTDNLIIKANTPNWFIHSGSGEDAIQADGGTNVLDGGTGSNFLVGGTSAGEFDTFFVDARGATADIWSTVVNFASGDNATMWGITPAMFNVAMVDNDGAANFTGLTFHATAPGAPEASLTLAGFTQADLASGKITQTFGTDPASGSAYMLLHAT